MPRTRSGVSILHCVRECFFLAGKARHVLNGRPLLICDYGAIAIAATIISPTKTAAARTYIYKFSKR